MHPTLGHPGLPGVDEARVRPVPDVDGTVWRSCERLFGLNQKLAGCFVRAMKPSALLAELRSGNVDSRAFPDDSTERLEVFQGRTSGDRQ